MKYLTVPDILEIHSFIIDETGGSHGVRDQDALLALEALPRQIAFGRELYPTIFDKAAVYVRNVIFAHPFVDGNKRTAMTSAGVFLADNGYTFNAKEREIEDFAVRVVVEKLELENIAAWLKKHAKRI